MISRIAEGVALVLLVLIWTGLRVAPALPELSPGGGETVLIGNDSWFHLHQARGAVEHFPRLLRWDVGTQFPEGSRVAAAGVFHLGLATVARLSGIEPTEIGRLVSLLAWSPVILGAMSLIFLFFLARDLGGRRLAWTTLILRVAFPGGELERTLFGFGDQHAAEILLVTASLWAWVRFEKCHSCSGKGWRWIAGMLAAIPVAAFLFTWFGAPLFVAILLAAYWAVRVLSVCQEEGDRSDRARAIPYFAGIFLITAVIGLLWREGVMVPEAWRFTLVALALQVVMLIVICRIPARFGPVARGLLMAGVLAVPAGIFLTIHPGVVALALNFLGPANRDVAEHAVDPLRFWWADYGLVLPWLVYGGGAGFWKGDPRPIHVVFAVIGLWAILAALRSDFLYLTGALFPLVAAYGGWRFMDLRGRRWPRWLPVSCSLFSLLLVWPAGMLRAPMMTRDEVAGMVVATKPWREAMRWIRDETPAPPIKPTFLAEPWRKRDGFAYPPGTGAIFTHWQYGNLVPALADRIAVSARSRSPEFIDWFLEQDESASHDRLGPPDGVRYVVLDAVSVCDLFVAEALQTGLTPEAIQVADGSDWRGMKLRSYGEPFRRSIGANLYLGDGSSMERYRLVHESRDVSFVRYRLRPDGAMVSLRSDLVEEEERDQLEPLVAAGATWEEPGGYVCYSGQILPSVKVFERVAGAVLKGTVSPGETVSLELPMVVPGSEREVVYRREAVAGADGAVVIRVPYATGPASPYRIASARSGAVERQVTVSETQVAAGATIDF